MLPVRSRVRQPAEFAATVRRGRRAGRPLVVVHLLAGPAGGSEPVRAGFVVSKAVGPAVVRNRVKRRLRHLVSQRLTAMPAGATLVVRANPASATASYAALGVDLDAALARAITARAARSAS